MIVISNKNFTADSIRLVQLLNSTTKVNMLKVCDKLDLYVSPNLKKDETARRIAQEMFDNPIEILSRLNKQELQIRSILGRRNFDDMQVTFSIYMIIMLISV